jgi:phospholipase/carboxylesterase
MTRARTSIDTRIPRRTLVAIALCLLGAVAGCDHRAPERGAPSSAVGARAPSAATAPAGQPAETRDAPLAGTSAGIAWIEIVTGGARPGDTLPLIIGLHGLGGKPQTFLEVLAKFPGRARIVTMEAPTPHGRGFAWFQIVNHDIESEDAAKNIGEAADRLATAIIALTHERPTAGLPILTGFSQGGAMTFAVAARHPEAIAAAFPLSGWLPPALVPSGAAPPSRPPIFAFHGTADERVPFADGKGAVARLLAAGYRSELRELPGMSHTVGPEERAELYQRIAASITPHP